MTLPSLSRLARHLFHPRWLARLAFPPGARARIADAVAASERRHAGEIRFVVEGALELPQLLRGIGARELALAVFSELHVWDTEANNGVLIYLLLADRDVEIVADRGLNGRVAPAEWAAICREMEARFALKAYEAGALVGVDRVHALLVRHFPAPGVNPNELPDAPALI